jgi:hypothetical protein
MLVAGTYDFPDECPSDCPHKNSFMTYGQSAICGRCPVFVCSEVPEEGWCLVAPDEYRPDWALAWYKWFRGGMQGYPDLLLTQAKDSAGPDPMTYTTTCPTCGAPIEDTSLAEGAHLELPESGKKS